MFSRKIGFTRWYDSVSELAQAVRMMEKIPEFQQRAISQVILDSVDMNAVRYKNDPGLKKLGTEKILGLMKSKSKRRWYDQDPIVHQAFNLLYMMDDNERRETGVKIIFSIRVMEEAFSRLDSASIEQMMTASRSMDGLVKTVFNKNMDYLASRMVLAPKSEPATPQPALYIVETAEAECPAEVGQASEGKEAGKNSGLLDHSEQGMKLIRLKRSHYRSFG